jgi:hypothetical protein
MRIVSRCVVTPQISLAANFTMLGTPVDLHAGNPHLKYYNETLFFQARLVALLRCCVVVASFMRLRACALSLSVLRGRAGLAAAVEREVHADQLRVAGARKRSGSAAAQQRSACARARTHATCAHT